MKRVSLFICAIIIFAFVFASCGVNESESKTDGDKLSMFVEIERGYCWDVYYHRTTKVMYVVSRSSHNMGNFTVLVNPDGSPMIWEEN